MELQARVRNVLTQPKAEWGVIAAEPTDIPTLYKEYIAILSAIPPLAGFIGMVLVGVTVPVLGTVRVGFAHGLATAIVQYVLGLIAVYVTALVVDKLAPTFQSQPNLVQALKLVAYAWTAGWVVGIVAIVPALAPLMILGGLYGIYLFYLGVTPLMKTPADKVIPYMVVSAVVVFIVMFVVGRVAGGLTGSVVPAGL